jgi:hypothetical protein
MLLKNTIPILLVAAWFTGLAGCASSSNQPSAPPSGAFNDSNLNGTYVFSFAGDDATSGFESQFAIAGTLTANGDGSFTAGTIDVDDPALGSALNTSYTQNRLPASGNYNITPDGRGTGSVSVTINGVQVQFGLDFVLTSDSHGLISRFDGNGSGSGTIDLQASNVTQSTLQGSYVFGFQGSDSTVVNPLATVGSFSLDANGNITSGLQDFGDNGNSIGLRALAVQGNVQAVGLGTAQLTTNATGFGTLHFDVFVIDPTHLKFIETDSTAYLAGDAFVSTNQTSFPSGPLAFTLAGEDTSQGPFAAGGLLTSDGSSQITGGLEDVNDNGYVGQAPSIHGSFSSNGVRTVVTLNGIYNGNIVNNTVGAGSYTFAAYPYTGGVMLLEIDNGGGNSTGVSGGNIYVQTATALTTSQGFGMNLSGVNNNGQVDWISEFTVNGSSVAGLYDANNFGLVASDLNLGTGNYSVGSNGRGTISFPSLQTDGNSFIGALNLDFYVVDNSTAVFLETDGNQLATGAIQLQTSSGASSAAQTRYSFMRPTTHANVKPNFRQ